jgi:hypothetical protein
MMARWDCLGEVQTGEPANWKLEELSAWIDMRGDLISGGIGNIASECSYLSQRENAADVVGQIKCTRTRTRVMILNPA